MRSLRLELTLGLVAAFSVLLAAGGSFVYFSVKSALYAQFDEGLRYHALTLAMATEVRRGRVELDFPDDTPHHAEDRDSAIHFQLWSGGRVVSRSDSLGRKDLPLRHGTIEFPGFWKLRLPGGEPGRAIGIEFVPRTTHDRGRPDDRDESAGASPATAVIVVAGGTSALRQELDRMQLLLSCVGAGLLLITGLVVPLVVGPRLRPLRRVAEQAGAIGAANLAQRFPVKDMPVELRPICERLNALLGRLGDSFERERRFSSDLAHEILTPLAELRVLAESAIKWPDTSGPEAHRQSLEVILRMQELITRLLDLARAENGRLCVETAPVALDALIRDSWRPFEAAAAARGLDVRLSGPDNARVTTDAVLLRAILRNLLSNAADYAPAGGKVVVEWSASPGGFMFRVANPAPQLAPGDAAQLFNRFWRKDESRTGNHSGLGLPLALQIARALGGTLEAVIEEGELALTFRSAAVQPGTRGGNQSSRPGDSQA